MNHRLVRYSAMQSTERYTHLAADWVTESAEQNSESIAAKILAGYSVCRGEASPGAPGIAKKEDGQGFAPELLTTTYASMKLPTRTWNARRL